MLIFTWKVMSLCFYQVIARLHLIFISSILLFYVHTILVGHWFNEIVVLYISDNIWTHLGIMQLFYSNIWAFCMNTYNAWEIRKLATWGEVSCVRCSAFDVAWRILLDKSEAVLLICLRRPNPRHLEKLKKFLKNHEISFILWDFWFDYLCVCIGLVDLIDVIIEVHNFRLTH